MDMSDVEVKASIKRNYYIDTCCKNATRSSIYYVTCCKIKKIRLTIWSKTCIITTC